MDQFFLSMDQRRLRLGSLLIAVNVLATILLVSAIFIGGRPHPDVDWIDFAVEGFSAFTYFLLFGVVIFTNFRSDIRYVFLTGTFIIQCGRLVDAIDEITLFDSPHWSVVGDGLTLIGELLIVFAAIRWVVMSNRQVNTDPLTSLFNRRYHENEMERLLQRARHEPLTFAVIAIDLDHFKSVNDTFGHAVGDAALRHTAEVLRQACRHVDSISRVGGEEFEVLVPNCDRDQAMMIAERIRNALNRQPPVGLERLTASLGVAISIPGDTLGSLRSRADSGVYKSKSNGRNRTSFADI